MCLPESKYHVLLPGDTEFYLLLGCSGMFVDTINLCLVKSPEVGDWISCPVQPIGFGHVVLTSKIKDVIQKRWVVVNDLCVN